MGIQKDVVKTNLFAGVFGIVCLLITGSFCYLMTMEVPAEGTLMMIITTVFIMWMVYIGVFTDLTLLSKLKKE